MVRVSRGARVPQRPAGRTPGAAAAIGLTLVLLAGPGYGQSRTAQPTPGGSLPGHLGAWIKKRDGGIVRRIQKLIGLAEMRFICNRGAFTGIGQICTKDRSRVQRKLLLLNGIIRATRSRRAVLDACDSQAFESLPPSQIVPRL